MPQLVKLAWLKQWAAELDVKPSTLGKIVHSARPGNHTARWRHFTRTLLTIPETAFTFTVVRREPESEATPLKRPS